MTDNITVQEGDRMNDVQTAEQETANKRGAAFKFALAAVVIVPCAAYLLNWHHAKGAASTQNSALPRPEEMPLTGGKPQVGTVADDAHAELRQEIKKELERQSKEMEQHIQLLNELNSNRYVLDEGIDGVPAGAPVSEATVPASALPEWNQRQAAPNQVVIQKLVELPSLQQSQAADALRQQASAAAGETAVDDAGPSSAAQMQLPPQNEPQERWHQEWTVTAAAKPVVTAQPTVKPEAAAPVLPQRNPPPSVVSNRKPAAGTGYRIRIVRVPPSAAVIQPAELPGQDEREATKEETVEEEIETAGQTTIKIPVSAGEF